MEQIDIETAQNVVVQHELASLGDRVVAYLIDGLVQVGWILFWVFIIYKVVDGYDLDDDLLMSIATILVILPIMLYHLISEITMDGQSIGKRAKKIRVARLDGSEPTIGQYLLRWILRVVDSFYFIGFVVILINGKGQRLGDLAAGTTIVSLKQRLKLTDTLLSEIAPGHNVRFPDAVRMNDAQARMIREVLNADGVKNKLALYQDLAVKVRKVIGDEGEGMASKVFLETVLKDYVFLTAQQTTMQG